MNTFYEHHQDNIKFNYRCFDRILLNGLIQPFQQPERVIGFFNAYREGQRVTRQLLRDIGEQFHNWVKNRAQKWGAPILEAPTGRRDDFVAPFFKPAKTDHVVVILKAREPARIMTAIGEGNRWHLQLAWRWIVQYSFYLCDQFWGRMFVRVCPYLPFSARVCLNQHHWLANKLRAEGIDFQQRANAFLRCSHPEKLQQLADSLNVHDLLTCGQKWLATFTPFFKESERQQAGYVSLRPFWNWFASLSERYDQPCPVCNYLQGFKWASISGGYEDVEAGLSRATFFIGVEKP